MVEFSSEVGVAEDVCVEKEREKRGLMKKAKMVTL